MPLHHFKMDFSDLQACTIWFPNRDDCSEKLAFTVHTPISPFPRYWFNLGNQVFRCTLPHQHSLHLLPINVKVIFPLHSLSVIMQPDSALAREKQNRETLVHLTIPTLENEGKPLMCYPHLRVRNQRKLRMEPHGQLERWVCHLHKGRSFLSSAPYYEKKRHRLNNISISY